MSPITLNVPDELAIRLRSLDLWAQHK